MQTRRERTDPCAIWMFASQIDSPARKLLVLPVDHCGSPVVDAAHEVGDKCTADEESCRLQDVLVEHRIEPSGARRCRQLVLQKDQTDYQQLKGHDWEDR